jgi:hypothetical protein
LSEDEKDKDDVMGRKEEGGECQNKSNLTQKKCYKNIIGTQINFNLFR